MVYICNHSTWEEEAGELIFPGCGEGWREGQREEEREGERGRRKEGRREGWKEKEREKRKAIPFIISPSLSTILEQGHPPTYNFNHGLK
jgi:hypothetical protein